MKKPGEMAEGMIAPCGVNCTVCSAHVQHQKKPCPGCREAIEKITRKSCQNCTKKKCAFEKGLLWCFQCEKFPCSAIKNLDKSYQKNYEVSIIQNGIEAKNDMRAFLLSQQKHYTCKNCGEVVDVHHKKCSGCGGDKGPKTSMSPLAWLYRKGAHWGLL